MDGGGFLKKAFLNKRHLTGPQPRRTLPPLLLPPALYPVLGERKESRKRKKKETAVVAAAGLPPVPETTCDFVHEQAEQKRGVRDPPATGPAIVRCSGCPSRTSGGALCGGETPRKERVGPHCDGGALLI